MSGGPTTGRRHNSTENHEIVRSPSRASGTTAANVSIEKNIIHFLDYTQQPYIADVAAAERRRKKFQVPRFGRRHANKVDSPLSEEVGTESVDDGDGNDEKSEQKQLGDDDDADETGETSSEHTKSMEEDSSDQSEAKPDSSTDPKPSPSESQATNQTRPAIVFMPPPHHMRPIQPPHHPIYQQKNAKRPSLMSSILPAFLPKPPPNHPFPPQPYNPNEVNTTILSLLLRLTLLTLSTHILDLFGPKNDAYLPSPVQHYTFERINDRYRKDRNALSLALNSPPLGVGRYTWKRVWNRRKKMAVHSLSEMEEEERELQLLSDEQTNLYNKNDVATIANGELYNKTVIILDIQPDARVGNGMAEHLRDTVSFLIEQHRDHLDRRRGALLHHDSNNPRTTRGIRSSLGAKLEILLLLDSPGGTVSDYGLASSHLSRLRNEPDITLTICIDRIAASGGYMMACQATPGHLFAAPFAMVGSIGVLMETVNFHEVLKKYGVRPLTIKAGRHKAPLKSLGEVSEEEIEYAQRDADSIHDAFRQWVVSSRPNVKATEDWVEKVCTGSVFLGKEAMQLGLVDHIKTSDEYISERIAAGDRVLRLIPYRGPQFGLKLSPLDLLLAGMDAESMSKIREVGGRLKGVFASLFRVGGAVGILNAVHHLALVGLRSGVCIR